MSMLRLSEPPAWIVGLGEGAVKLIKELRTQSRQVPKSLVPPEKPVLVSVALTLRFSQPLEAVVLAVTVTLQRLSDTVNLEVEGTLTLQTTYQPALGKNPALELVAGTATVLLSPGPNVKPAAQLPLTVPAAG